MKNKKYWLILSLTFVVSLSGWYSYQKVTDDTYEGMSIIPEHHKDIPLFPGLEPTRNDYVMEEDHWREVYAFYEKQLPKHGWNKAFMYSALDNDDPDDDWSGFYSRWTKKGFDGELTLGAGYNQHENQTEVIFDKNPIFHASPWIDQVPKSICIHADSLKSECITVTDPNEIKAIVQIINDAYDTNEKVPSDKYESKITFGSFEVYIQYRKDEMIYLRSSKGTKEMKPEQEFLALIRLSKN
ncbi:hypothetical protein [Neobacillus bataviensis]|uniref:hypothetical protein n=1 Tax=Neobacillus bataviensis TaxID=220685 RepID=UPI001CBB028C|nr:hypothetical protein [Neobacillus bataviensis]